MTVLSRLAFACALLLAFAPARARAQIVHIGACSAGSCDTSTVTVQAAATPDTGLFSGYSARSPHWPSASWAWTDFWYSYNDTTTRSVLASRYDNIIGGCDSCYHRLNPTIGHEPYYLHWTVIYPHGTNHDDTWSVMRAWLVTHGYSLEAAFLHQPGSVGDSASRDTLTIWGSTRWLLNPADPGVRAFGIARLREVRASGANGIFYDEYGRGSVTRWWPSLEGDSLWYARATAARLTMERDSVPGSRIIINSASYTSWYDSATVLAARGAHLEGTDDPRSANITTMWAWIDKLVRGGATYLEFVNASAWGNTAPASMTAGNEISPFTRMKMAEYASYLMVRDTGRVLHNAPDNAWLSDPSTHWLKAFEANLGVPTTARAVWATGADPQGRNYVVYTRRYSRGALVMLRVVTGWTAQDFGDAAAVSVPVPSGYTRQLRSDGSVLVVGPTVTLRAGEGMILLQ